MLSFTLLTPLVTFLMLWARGLPNFAQGYFLTVVFWVYSVTWAPALLAGALLAAVVYGVIRRTDYFHKPYDFGRCFSLGAITGSLAEALSTWAYRELIHHPFSDFWIAGAMISGCLVGAGLTAWLLAGHS